jgi:hypothetical protein
MKAKRGTSHGKRGAAAQEADILGGKEGILIAESYGIGTKENSQDELVCNRNNGANGQRKEEKINETESTNARNGTQRTIAPTCTTLGGASSGRCRSQVVAHAQDFGL